MEINKKIYEYLKDVARKKKGTKGIIFYNELAKEFNLPFEDIADRNCLFEIIGNISIYEVSQNRPMLSVVVVHKDKMRVPGDGFFNLAIELNIWDGKGDKLLFFGKELKRVLDYWSKH